MRSNNRISNVMIWNQPQNGKNSTETAKQFNVNEAIVETFKRNKEKFEVSINAGLSIALKCTSYRSNNILERKERASFVLFLFFIK